MTEETIQTTFRSSDWFASICDTCCQTDKWVVLWGDERVCNTCLETHFDEEGDKIVTDEDLVFGNDYRQKIANAAIVLLLSGFFAGLVFGALLFEGPEISEFVGRYV
jgi:hypothetical protein